MTQSGRIRDGDRFVIHDGRVSKERGLGFTLIEVMIAVGILASISALIFGSFSVVSRSKRDAERISARYHQVRVAMTRMAREISMAYLSQNDRVGATVPRTFFVSRKRSSVDDLMFSSFAHVRVDDDLKESDQSVVRYFDASRGASDGRVDLMRRESRRLGGEHPGEEGSAFVMVEGVEALHFEYFDSVANEWRDEWDTRSVDGQPNRLPLKVRILLTLKDENNREVVFRTATRIHLQDAIWSSGARG